MNEGVEMVQFGQGFMSMAAPTAELLRLVKARQLLHSTAAIRCCDGVQATSPNGPGREHEAGQIAQSGDRERSIRSIMNTDSGDHEHRSRWPERLKMNRLAASE
jgi:hypothetical protein